MGREQGRSPRTGGRRAAGREEHPGVLPPVKDWCGGALRSPRPGARTRRIQNAGETSPQTTPGRFALGTLPHVLGQRSLGPGSGGTPLHACWKGENSQTLTAQVPVRTRAAGAVPQLLAAQAWAAAAEDAGSPRAGHALPGRPSAHAPAPSRQGIESSRSRGSLPLRFTAAPSPRSRRVVRPWGLRQPRCRRQRPVVEQRGAPCPFARRHG